MKRKGDYRYILYSLAYLKHYKLTFVLVIFMSMVAVVLSLVPVELMKRIIDVAIPGKDLHMVFVMVIIVFVLHIFLLIINYIQDLMTARLSLKVTRKMQTDFFGKLLRLPYSEFAHLNEGQLMEKVIDDTESITDSTFDLIISPILDIISLAITVAYMFMISPRLALIALAFVPIFLIIIIPINRITRKKYARIRQAFGDVYSVVQEKLAGIKEIVVHNRSDDEVGDFKHHLKRYNDLEYDYERFSTKLQSLIAIISDLAPYTILLYAAYLIIEGRFEIGTLMAFTMLLPRLFGPIKELAGKELEIQTLGVDAKRVFSLLHDAKTVPDGDLVLEKEDIKGCLEFKGVGYSFDSKEVFRGIDFKVMPGKMVAVVGDTGVGKSTILHLILRTLEVNTGNILLDGKDVRSFTTRSLRHNIAIVNQEPFIFSDTILHNIAYGHPKGASSIREVISASEIVGLHKTIAKLPHKYLTKVGREGGVLSDGQARRLSLARAVMRAPKILLLDDPTACLDSDAASNLVTALGRLKKGRTLIVVTSDPKVLKKCDDVVFLTADKGFTSVGARGKHGELVRKNKLYKGIVG